MERSSGIFTEPTARRNKQQRRIEVHEPSAMLDGEWKSYILPCFKAHIERGEKNYAVS